MIPTTGETSANVWYRIYLTVRDAQGQTHTTFSEVRPRTATITVTAQYSGLTVTLDGQPSGATLTFPAVVGMIREIGTPSPQTIGNFTYTFRTWSDDGAQTHQVTIPASNTTFTARFRRNKN